MSFFHVFLVSPLSCNGSHILTSHSLSPESLGLTPKLCGHWTRRPCHSNVTWTWLEWMCVSNTIAKPCQPFRLRLEPHHTLHLWPLKKTGKFKISLKISRTSFLVILEGPGSVKDSFDKTVSRSWQKRWKRKIAFLLQKFCQVWWIENFQFWFDFTWQLLAIDHQTSHSFRNAAVSSTYFISCAPFKVQEMRFDAATRKAACWSGESASNWPETTQLGTVNCHQLPEFLKALWIGLIQTVWSARQMSPGSVVGQVKLALCWVSTFPSHFDFTSL